MRPAINPALLAELFKSSDDEEPLPPTERRPDLTAAYAHIMNHYPEAEPTWTQSKS